MEARNNSNVISATGLWSVAWELGIVFAGSTLPTPLYLIYRRAFGFSEITLTLIYAVYVLGNLFALFVFGRLSDQVGRKRTTWAALAIAALSTLTFIFTEGTWWLFPARLLSGLATGLAAGAATAWIAELHPDGDKNRAAIIAAASNLAGLSLGPLMAGSLARYGPWPLRLSYLIYLAMLAAIVVMLLRVRETVEQPVHKMSQVSLRPRIGVPREIQAPFVSPAVTAFGIFSLIGFYSALVPSLLATSLQRGSPAVSGSVVGGLFITAALTAAFMRKLKSDSAMLYGLVLLLPSLACLVISQGRQSMPFLLVGTVLGGISAAFGYCGGLQVINRISPDNRRSEVVSAYLIACYAGNSVPVVGIGLLSRVSSSMTAHVVFAVVIGVFAVVGLVTGVKYRAS